MSDTAALDRSILAKVRLRLLLPCALLLFVSAIDRANMSFAALRMNKDLDLSSSAYGLAAGIFFIGYLLAQFPSVALLERIGMRRWSALIALLWGVAATSMAFVETAGQLYALRFLLGVAEAGLAPGILLYLSGWGDERTRASMVAIPLAAIPMSLVIGGPLSGALLDMANPFGLADWRWMFLAEGLPTIVLAGVALWYFPDDAAQATWLDSTERNRLDEIVPTRKSAATTGAGRWTILADSRAWLCAFIWFSVLAGNYGVIFWLPQAVSTATGFSATTVGFIVALPWLANVIAVLWNARASDRSGERYLRLAIPSLVAGVVLLAAIVAGSSMIAIILLVILGAALGAALAPFWALPNRLLPPAHLAFAITLINILGSMSGLLVPMLIGVVHQRVHSFAIPMMILAAIMICGAVLALIARHLDPARAAVASGA